MASIQSPGIGSGLDINGLVSKLMDVERQPLNALDTKEIKQQAKLTAFGTIKSSLTSLQSSVSSLSNAYQFLNTSASVSDSDAVSVSSFSTAQLGTHTVKVNQLAQAQRIASGTFVSTDAVVGTGTLTVEFGTIDGDEADEDGYYSGNDFIPNGAQSAVTITIGATNNSLSGVRDAINAANGGITASILNDGTGYRLVIASNNSGAENAMKITVSGDSDGDDVDTAGLSQLSYDPTADAEDGQNLYQVAAAQSALVMLDGLLITSKSNTLGDAIAGVSLTVKKVTTADSTFTISRNVEGASKSIESFVKAYNDANKAMADLTAYDPVNKTAATLQGESTIRTIQNSLRSTLGGVLPGGTFTRLSEVGISFGRDGTLSYNSAKFNSAVTKDASAVAGLFGEYGATTDGQVRYISASTATKVGSYGVSVNQVATQSILEATNASVLGTLAVPPGQTDSLFLTVDGISTGAIGFTETDYEQDETGLAALMQSRINGDASLKAAGASVSVAFDSDTGKFSITSNRYGSKSSVNISTITTFLSDNTGLTVQNGSTGLDVSGSIGSLGATGSGRFLTGQGEAQDLQLEILGGLFDNDIGAARGTVSYNRGFAYQMNVLLEKMISTNGILSARTEGINSQIGDIGKQREVLTRRFDDTELRYRKQFSALDTLVSQLQTTSSYLTQQLSSLSSSSR